MRIGKDIEERIYAGLLGKAIGVYLGRPVEGWPYEDIISRYGELDWYVNKDQGIPLIVADDDLSGTSTFFRAMEDNGFSPDITAEDIGRTWLNYIIEDRTILWWGGIGNSTEHTAYLRLKSGVKAPVSGSIALEGNEIKVAPTSNSRQSRAMYGTARSIIAGMVKGVVEEFKKVLEIKGVGFKADLKGKVLTLALGYAHPCILEVPEGITVVIGETPDRNPLLTVSGADKQMVGEVAAKIKHFYPVEPYKGKGVRIHGEFVRRKEGKKTA